MGPHFDPDNLNDADATLEDYLAIAADIVRDLAPPADPPAEGYAERAARAERLLLNYLVTTGGGVLKGKTISGVTAKTFNDDAAVRAIVARTMGRFASDSGAGGGNNVGVISPSPF